MSDYHDAQLSIDFRPFISTDNKLILERDYYIANDQFTVHTTDTADRVVTIFVKNLPALITSQTGTISLSRYWFVLLVELILFYAKRKDDNLQPEQDPIIKSMMREVRRTINTISGSVRNYEVRYDIVS